MDPTDPNHSQVGEAPKEAQPPGEPEPPSRKRPHRDVGNLSPFRFTTQAPPPKKRPVRAKPSSLAIKQRGSFSSGSSTRAPSVSAAEPSPSAIEQENSLLSFLSSQAPPIPRFTLPTLVPPPTLASIPTPSATIRPKKRVRIRSRAGKAAKKLIEAEQAEIVKRLVATIEKETEKKLAVTKEAPPPKPEKVTAKKKQQSDAEGSGGNLLQPAKEQLRHEAEVQLQEGAKRLEEAQHVQKQHKPPSEPKATGGGGKLALLANQLKKKAEEEEAHREQQKRRMAEEQLDQQIKKMAEAQREQQPQQMTGAYFEQQIERMAEEHCLKQAEQMAEAQEAQKKHQRPDEKRLAPHPPQHSYSVQALSAPTQHGTPNVIEQQRFLKLPRHLDPLAMHDLLAETHHQMPRHEQMNSEKSMRNRALAMECMRLHDERQLEKQRLAEAEQGRSGVQSAPRQSQQSTLLQGMSVPVQYGMLDPQVADAELTPIQREIKRRQSMEAQEAAQRKQAQQQLNAPQENSLLVDMVQHGILHWQSVGAQQHWPARIQIPSGHQTTNEYTMLHVPRLQDSSLVERLQHRDTPPQQGASDHKPTAVKEQEPPPRKIPILAQMLYQQSKKPRRQSTSQQKSGLVKDQDAQRRQESLVEASGVSTLADMPSGHGKSNEKTAIVTGQQQLDAPQDTSVLVKMFQVKEHSRNQQSPVVPSGPVAVNQQVPDASRQHQKPSEANDLCKPKANHSVAALLGLAQRETPGDQGTPDHQSSIVKTQPQLDAPDHQQILSPAFSALRVQTPQVQPQPPEANDQQSSIAKEPKAPVRHQEQHSSIIRALLERAPEIASEHPRSDLSRKAQIEAPRQQGGPQSKMMEQPQRLNFPRRLIDLVAPELRSQAQHQMSREQGAIPKQQPIVKEQQPQKPVTVNALLAPAHHEVSQEPQPKPAIATEQRQMDGPRQPQHPVAVDTARGMTSKQLLILKEHIRQGVSNQPQNRAAVKTPPNQNADPLLKYLPSPAQRDMKGGQGKKSSIAKAPKRLEAPTGPPQPPPAADAPRAPTPHANSRRPETSDQQSPAVKKQRRDVSQRQSLPVAPAVDAPAQREVSREQGTTEQRPAIAKEQKQVDAPRQQQNFFHVKVLNASAPRKLSCGPKTSDQQLATASELRQVDASHQPQQLVAVDAPIVPAQSETPIGQGTSSKKSPTTKAQRLLADLARQPIPSTVNVDEKQETKAGKQVPPIVKEKQQADAPQKSRRVPAPVSKPSDQKEAKGKTPIVERKKQQTDAPQDAHRVPEQLEKPSGHKTSNEKSPIAKEKLQTDAQQNAQVVPAQLEKPSDVRKADKKTPIAAETDAPQEAQRQEPKPQHKPEQEAHQSPADYDLTVIEVDGPSEEKGYEKMKRVDIGDLLEKIIKSGSVDGDIKKKIKRLKMQCKGALQERLWCYYLKKTQLDNAQREKARKVASGPIEEVMEAQNPQEIVELKEAEETIPKKNQTVIARKVHRMLEMFETGGVGSPKVGSRKSERKPKGKSPEKETSQGNDSQRTKRVRNPPKLIVKKPPGMPPPEDSKLMLVLVPDYSPSRVPRRQSPTPDSDQSSCAATSDTQAQGPGKDLPNQRSIDGMEDEPMELDESNARSEKPASQKLAGAVRAHGSTADKPVREEPSPDLDDVMEVDEEKTSKQMQAQLDRAPRSLKRRIVEPSQNAPARMRPQEAPARPPSRQASALLPSQEAPARPPSRRTPTPPPSRSAPTPPRGAPARSPPSQDAPAPPPPQQAPSPSPPPQEAPAPQTPAPNIGKRSPHSNILVLPTGCGTDMSRWTPANCLEWAIKLVEDQDPEQIDLLKDLKLNYYALRDMVCMNDAWRHVVPFGLFCMIRANFNKVHNVFHGFG